MEAEPFFVQFHMLLMEDVVGLMTASITKKMT